MINIPFVEVSKNMTLSELKRKINNILPEKDKLFLVEDEMFVKVVQGKNTLIPYGTKKEIILQLSAFYKGLSQGIVLKGKVDAISPRKRVL